MCDCIFYISENIDGIIEHEYCTNEDLKTQNKSNGKNIKCIGIGCGKYEKNEKEEDCK